MSEHWYERESNPAAIPNEAGEISVERVVYAGDLETTLTAIREAAEGLSEVTVDARDLWDCPSIIVEGRRRADADELAAGEEYAAHLKEMGLVRARALLREAGEL